MDGKQPPFWYERREDISIIKIFVNKTLPFFALLLVRRRRWLVRMMAVNDVPSYVTTFGNALFRPLPLRLLLRPYSLQHSIPHPQSRRAS